MTMETPAEAPEGPNFTIGIPLDSLAVGAMMAGHVQGEAVLLVRRATSIVAVGAYCTHYGTPLVGGILDGDTVRCPLHHACFDLDRGTALRAPAFEPLPRWRVEVREGRVYITGRIEDAPAPARAVARIGARMVIVGGGAAGDAAAACLRDEGYTGAITILSADAHAPGDRPNFSKGTIAGTVAMDFNFVRPAGFYEHHDIDLRLGTTVSELDVEGRTVRMAGGEVLPYDALLLASGAEPVRLGVPGAELPHVRTLRSLADSLEIAARAEHATSAVVVGASFIAMETAAALRARGVAVHVVAPDAVPMARVLGPEIGAFMQALHERNGVTFHLGTTVAAITPERVQLDTGETVDADLVIVGIGVRPRVELAAQAGLAVDNGVLVNARLETSKPGVYAAGDIARWMDNATGLRTRVEHWVVAQRQGQLAARNMLGAQLAFDAVPFFWTEHYGLTLLYVGHAERGFTTTVAGSLTGPSPSARVDYHQDGRLVAVATIGRDRESLDAEVAFERLRA